MSFANVILGIVVILLGVYPLLKDGPLSFLSFLPYEGAGYAGLLIAVGAVILLYNSKRRRVRFRFR